MRYTLLICVLFLSSCGIVSKVQTMLDGAAVSLDTAKDYAAKGEAAFAEIKAHKAKADTDGDGKTSTSEWLAYLLTLVGVGGGAIGIRNAKSNARKTATELRVDVLEKA